MNLTCCNQFDIVRTQDSDSQKINFQILKWGTVEKFSSLQFPNCLIFISDNFQNYAVNNVHNKIPQISWKQSQSDAPIPLAAMCLFDPHWSDFQNGDCFHTMSSWAIKLMKLNIYFQEDHWYHRWVPFYWEHTTYLICRSLGTDTMPQWTD